MFSNSDGLVGVPGEISSWLLPKDVIQTDNLKIWSQNCSSYGFRVLVRVFHDPGEWWALTWEFLPRTASLLADRSPVLTPMPWVSTLLGETAWLTRRSGRVAGGCHFDGDQRCSSAHHSRYEDCRSHSPGVRRILQRGRSSARSELFILLTRLQASPYEFDWKKSFFGSHYHRLLTIKHRYDPNSMFLVHEGIGSEGTLFAL
jgi:hypothetical protein